MPSLKAAPTRLRMRFERWGFSTKTTHQDYQFNPEKMNVHKKWRIHFESGVEDDLPWKFKPQQKKVQINAGETALVFYKAINL